MQSKKIIPFFFCTSLLIIVSTTSFTQKGKKFEQKKQNQQGQKNFVSKMSDLAIPIGNMIIGSPTNNSVTASVILEKDAEGFIEYAIESGKYNYKTSMFKTKNSEPLEINIDQLKPNSLYYYRLNYRLAGESKFTVTSESWFATQKNPTTSFSFGIQGDSHPERVGKMFNSNLYQQTIEHVTEYKPDFYFMLGDDFT